MRRTSWQVLVLVALAAGAVSWLGLRLWQRQAGALPPAPWSVVAVIVAMAIALVVFGWPIGKMTRTYRRELRERGQLRDQREDEPLDPNSAAGQRRRIDPLRAARILVLAKAASLTGSLLFGWYGATLLHLLTGPVPRQTMAWSTGAAALAAVILAAAGIIVEWFCQIPPGGTGLTEDESVDPAPGSTHRSGPMRG